MKLFHSDGRRDDVLRFARVRPVSIFDAIRLFTGFASAVVYRLTGLKRIRPALADASPGIFIPGDSNIQVELNGLSITMRPSEIPILVGVHEPRTISWFRPRPGECVVDVGAHIGLYALMAANKGARVIAVEPDESNYALLKENVNTNGFDSNVRVFKGVISDVSGERLLYRSTGRNTWMSSVEKGWTPPDTHGVVPVVFVKSMTLDELVSEMNIQRIDWLKVDVEGHEVHVLNGGRRALSITSNLILEVPMGAEADARTCLAILQRTGMRVKATEGCGIVQNWFCVRA